MSEPKKDEFGKYLNYKSPNVHGFEEALKKIVYAFINNILSGKTDKEKRMLLPQYSQCIHLCVDHVMGNLPDGIDRVDGDIIKPILRQVCKEQIDLLPELPKLTEEV
jgi:hypothetical protein